MAGQQFFVHFKVKTHVNYGESVAVTGSTRLLGSWDINQAVSLKWSSGDHWVAECIFEEKEEVQYKYIKRDCTGGVKEWLPGENLVVHVCGESVKVEDVWDQKPYVISSQDIYEADVVVAENGAGKIEVAKDIFVEKKPAVPSLVDDDGDARVMNHSSGKELDIGGPIQAVHTAYGPEKNAILLDLVGSSVLTPKFPKD